MTRPTPRRPSAPRPKRPPAFAITGNPACPPSETRGWTIVAAVIVGAFVAAGIAAIAGPHRIGDYFTESDFYGAYAQGARLIQHGRLIPTRYTVVGPGYEIALALVGLVVRNLFVAAELLSLASAAAIAALWFALLRRRVDARLGVAAVLFLCMNDGLFRYAFSATTDAFGIALQAAALFALLGAPAERGAAASGEPGGGRAAPGAPSAARANAADAGAGRAALDVAIASRGSVPAHTRRLIAAGLLAAFAFLTRYNAVVLLPAGLLAILAGGTRGAGETEIAAPRRARAAAAFMVAFLLPVVPWVLYSLAHGGTLGTQLHHNIAYEVFARSKGIAWDDYQRNMQSQFPNLGAVIARDPGAVLGRMLANVVEHLRDDAVKLLGWPVALAALAGLLLALRGGWWRPLWPVLASGALLFLTLVPVFYSERYSLALLPVYATLAGAAFASPLLALAAGGRRRVWLKSLALCAVAAVVLPVGLARLARTFQQLPFEVLDAGNALRALRAPGDRVISRKGHIAFYGDCEPLPFPFADSLADLGRYARASHARWLYMSWPEAETRPAFYYLLDTAAVVPGLAARFSSPRRPAVVYEIGPGFGAEPAWLANDTLRTYHTLRGRTHVNVVDPVLFTQLGMTAWWLGHVSEAREALDKALALDPNNRDACSYMGRVQVALGDYDAARFAYRRALEQEPRDADARVGYGLASFLSGHDREAAQAWRKVIPMTIEPRILRAMAQLYDSLGDDEAAREARARLAGLDRR